MKRYNKAIGSIIGGVIGIGLIYFDLSPDGSVPPAYAPLVNMLQTALFSAIGTWLAPANTK